MATETRNKIILHVPTREDIEAIRVGDLALDAFGRYSVVTEITAKREDIAGRLFCHYYTTFGDRAQMSMGQKEGELVRHAGTHRVGDSATLRHIEFEMKAA